VPSLYKYQRGCSLTKAIDARYNKKQQKTKEDEEEEETR
jgi:hypothetical protein